MALFKIEKGKANNLAVNRPNTVEGYCYLTTDDGKFYIDIATGNGTQNRIVLNAGRADKLGKDSVGNKFKPIYLDQGMPKMGAEMLPITAGPDHKLQGALGIADISHGPTLPATGFDGEIFFLYADPIYVPAGGALGEVLTKTGDGDGQLAWKKALPIGGSTGQIIVKKSAADGDADWQDFPELHYLPLGGGIITNTTDSTSTTTGAVVINGGLGVAKNIYATSVYGAVWNDYAEFRNQKEKIEPGYCVASTNNGQVYKTIEKFQACDGIVSDTFGFAIGETNECRTPLAVAGRVLAYFNGNREDYQAGDTVCAGPKGKICKMTREEIKEYPDRIIGIVSEIPTYKTWGTNNISVDNRIWIKVK